MLMFILRMIINKFDHRILERGRLNEIESPIGRVALALLAPEKWVAVDSIYRYAQSLRHFLHRTEVYFDCYFFILLFM